MDFSITDASPDVADTPRAVTWQHIVHSAAPDVANAADTPCPPPRQHIVHSPAPDVANRPRAAARQRLVCRFDQRPCEVTAPCDPALHPIVAGYLTCTYCGRCQSSQAAALRGVRLGAVERRLLVAAPPIDADAGLMIEEKSRAMSVAAHRAIAKLARLGLLVSRDCDGKAERETEEWIFTVTVHRKRIWRTPLGEAVTKAFAAELADGARIRWQSRALAPVAKTREEIRVMSRAIATRHLDFYRMFEKSAVPQHLAAATALDETP